MSSITFNNGVYETERPTVWEKILQAVYAVLEYGALKLENRLMVRLLLKKLQKWSRMDSELALQLSKGIPKHDSSLLRGCPGLSEMVTMLTERVASISEREALTEKLGAKYGAAFNKLSATNRQNIGTMYDTLRLLKRSIVRVPKPADEEAQSAARRSAETIKQIYAR